MSAVYFKRNIWWFIIGLLLASESYAQSAEQEPLFESQEYFTVDQLVAWVWERNPGITELNAAVDVALHRIEPAGSLDDPTFGYAFAPRTFGRPGQRFNQKIEFNQKLPWPGTLAAQKAVAVHQATKARTDVDALRLELAALAKSAYAEWFFIQRALTIYQSTQALLGELLVMAETRYAVGQALQQDAIQAEMEQATLERHLLQLTRLKISVRAEINALLNRDTSASLPVPADLATLVNVPALSELERYALDAHPELMRAQSQIDANMAQVTLAERAFYPNFQFTAGYNSLWDEADKRPVVGLSINIPLDRSKRRAALNSAKANLRQVTSQRDNLRTQLLGEIAQARAELIESVDAVALYQGSLLPLANEYLQAAVADYRSGAGTFFAVITAEQQKLTTEENLARNRADILRGIAKVEHLSGRTLTLNGQTLSGERR